MKNKGLIITLIAILSIVSIALISLMIMVINNKAGGFMFNFSSKVSDTLVMDETYENEFDKININSSTSDISVLSSSDDSIRVVIYGDKEKLAVKTDNAELYISFEEKKCFGFCFNMTKNKIEVYLPDNYDKQILIKNDYGDIDVASFENANIEVNEECGDVYIEKGNNVKVENDYGDIKVDEANLVDLKESAGDVKLGTVKKATVENNYGDITAKNILESLDVSDDCGDIKIESLNLEKDSYIKNALGDIEIGPTNEIYIDAKTDLGNVKINNNFHQSSITLKIENDCGDIKVDN